MKEIILVLLLTLGAYTTGCGIAENLSKNCKGAIDPYCDAILGGDADEIANQEERIDNLEEELKELEISISNSIDILNSVIEANYTDTTGLIANLQNDIDLMVIRIAVLEGYKNISEIIDPCGVSPGNYNEVILKTSDGSYLAYFEQGSKRFLTLLKQNVLYQTTDGSSPVCRFKIDSNNELVDNL